MKSATRLSVSLAARSPFTVRSFTPKKDFADALALLQDPTFNVAPVFSKMVPLTQYQEAFADALTGNFAKIVLDFKEA